MDTQGPVGQTEAQEGNSQVVEAGIFGLEQVQECRADVQG